MPDNLNPAALDVYTNFNQGNTPTPATPGSALEVYRQFNENNTDTNIPASNGRRGISLEERALRKAAKQGYQGDDLLGFARADEFYDADTLYSDEFGGGVRVGNRLSDTNLYANAPERNKDGAQTADYLASRIALDRYAQGLPAETKDFYDELRSDPAKLAKYQAELGKASSDLLQVRGEQGKVGVHGRQVGQVYNPSLEGESLQDRLVATGNAKMYDQGEEKGRAGNMVDALQYGLGRAASGIADAFVDTATWMVREGYKGFTGEGEQEAVKWINDNSSLFARDKSGDFVGLADYGEAEEYGYDNSRTKEVTQNLGKAFESGDMADMAGAVLEGVVTAGPEFFLESAGEMAAAMTGVGVVGIAGKYSNEILDERQANLAPGTELSMGDRAFAVAVGAGVSLLNKLGADEIVGNTKVIKGAMNLIGKPGGDTAAKQILSTLALKATETAGKGAYEGLEEVAQEMLQKVGEKYGTAAQDELLSSETGKELFQAFGGGFAGGATPGAAVGAYDAATKPFVAEGAFADAVNKAGAYAGDAVGTVKDVAGKGVDAAKGVVDTFQGKASDEFEADYEAKRQTLVESEEYKSASPEEQAAIDQKFEERYKASQEAYKEAEAKAQEADGASMSTPEDNINEAPVTPTDKTPEAAEAEVAVAKTAKPVADVAENTANTPEVDAGLEAFDTGFDAILANLSGPINQFNEATTVLEEAGEEMPAGKEEQYTQGTVTAAQQFIEKLSVLKTQVVEAGAGPRATRAMEEKIAKLIPLVEAKSTAELTTVLASPEVTTTQKVRSVLGSSAASVAQLEEVAQSPDISTLDKKLIEAKIEAVKTYKAVAAEKVIGGGAKPGVFQWLSHIQENGSINDIAMENITNFVAGQRRKLKAFKDAKAAFELAGDNKPVRVNYGAKNVYKGAASDGLIDIIQKESDSIESLMDVAVEAAGIPNTTTATQNQPNKPETKEAPQVVPKTPKEAPTSTEDKLPSVNEVAAKIAKGEKLTPADMQTQSNEKKAVEARLQVLKEHGRDPDVNVIEVDDTPPTAKEGKERAAEIAKTEGMEAAIDYVREYNKDATVVLPTKQETLSRLDSALALQQDIQDTLIPELGDVQPTSNKDLLSEVSDVAALVELLGIPTSKDVKIPTLTQSLRAQTVILQFLQDVERGKESVDKIPVRVKNAVKWAAPVGVTPKRKDRAIWGAGKYSTDARKHLLTQLAEELVEVVEEVNKAVIDGKVPDLTTLAIEAQKRQLKVIRFTPTVKDKKTGKTNTELADDAVSKLKAAKDTPANVEAKVNDEDLTEPEYEEVPIMDDGDFEQGEEIYMDVEEVDTTPVEDVPVKPKVEKTISKGQTKRDEGTIRADMEANLDAALEAAPVGIKSRIKKIISDCKG